ncbi:MAG: prepilin-type N-terminal cleavage/methylation domain-containing protein [Gammaproteobacteria bacterium]|nr:prepilin-type N-terminal cleavage/methylation domain-containing protein [Gammaproteobacteria bacterium]
MKRLKVLQSGGARQSSQGFTLLEVMLAFVIFALSFATVLEIVAGSMRSVRRASDDTEVALFVQSIVDLVGNEIPIEEGQYGGTGMDRYEWQLELTLYAASDDDVSEAAVNTVELAELSGIELYRVDLYIDWESGNRQRDMHFSTIRSVLANR